MAHDDLLYNHLKGRLKVCKLNSARTEINIRCPFCLDSQKDPYKGHLYIQNGSPYKYFCQRCQSSGVVNKNFLELLECEDYHIINTIQNQYNEYKKKVKIKYGNDLDFILNKKIIYPKYSYIDKIKNDYLEERLGIKINDDDINRYKIVYNLKEFIIRNNLKILENNKKNYYYNLNVEKITNNCIGFLSNDKSTIIFRSLDKDKTGFRYSNFTLFPEIDSKKTYTIGNRLNLNNRIFEVVITEGIFDIIGVHNHIYNKQQQDNSIFIANAGKSFAVTANLLKKLAILNGNITIYSDGDVSVQEYRNLILKEKYFSMNGINIFYNKKSKDYGVTKDNILLSDKIEL